MKVTITLDVLLEADIKEEVNKEVYELANKGIWSNSGSLIQSAITKEEMELLEEIVENAAKRVVKKNEEKNY